MRSLPPLPALGESVTPEQMEHIEIQVVCDIASIDDLHALMAWHEQGGALSLSGLRFQHPVAVRHLYGAVRRVEARIGQLLGDRKSHPLFPRSTVHLCQLLFKVQQMGGLTDTEWQQGMRQIRFTIRSKYPTLMRSAIYTKRLQQIRELAATGANAAQIGQKLCISRDHVSQYAKHIGIELHTTGTILRLQSKHLERLVFGILTDVEGLSILDHTELPSVQPALLNELQGAVSHSIAQLKRLQRRLGGLAP